MEVMPEPMLPPQTNPGGQEPAMTSLRAILEVQTPATEQSLVLPVSGGPLDLEVDIPLPDPLLPSWGATFQPEQATVLEEGERLAAAPALLVDLVGGHVTETLRLFTGAWGKCHYGKNLLYIIPEPTIHTSLTSLFGTPYPCNPLYPCNPPYPCNPLYPCNQLAIGAPYIWTCYIYTKRE